MPTLAKAPRSVTETTIMNRIRAALAAMPDVTIFRNNVGMLRDARGTPIRYGLAVGSADLVGSLTQRHCPREAWDLSARSFARALAIEVKRPGEHPRPEQLAWMASVQKAGWIVGVCTSVEEAVNLIERARRWEI